MCSLTVLLICVSHLLNDYFNIYSHDDSMLGILIKEMNNSSCAYEFSFSLSLFHGKCLFLFWNKRNAFSSTFSDNELWELKQYCSE